MKTIYDNRTNSFSLIGLTEDEANAILRSLGIIVEKMIYDNELGFYKDNGDCFAMPAESYKAAVRLVHQLNHTSL